MRAYNKVIDSIELTEGAISNTDDIKNINGIGDKIATKIKELIETGKMSAVENALKDPRFSLQKQLGKLYGVGPVKINELMDKISSFEELYERRDELLNDKQKIGLLYYNDMSLRIPISEGKKHYKIIDKIFKKSNELYKAEIEQITQKRLDDNLSTIQAQKEILNGIKELKDGQKRYFQKYINEFKELSQEALLEIEDLKRELKNNSVDCRL
mgnify:CR=1 FL=1